MTGKRTLRGKLKPGVVFRYLDRTDHTEKRAFIILPAHPTMPALYQHLAFSSRGNNPNKQKRPVEIIWSPHLEDQTPESNEYGEICP